MKRIAFVLALAIVAALVLAPGVAFANYKIHGGYANDTDACAGCHRAHTSVSSITWSDGRNDHSALLVSNATKMYEFCYACHGNDAQGAQTNVEGGVFKGSIEGSANAPLNGGFAGSANYMGLTKTSDHIIEDGWGAYGGGFYGEGTSTATGMNPAYIASDGTPIPAMVESWGTGNVIPMTCASCHDPHGSSNYRLLADKVNGNAVGGYLSDSQPTPYVVSVEQGYPNGTVGDLTVGWKKHEPGNDQMDGGNGWPGYIPNYTTPQYAYPVDASAATTSADNPALKGMSGWCAGCHSVYLMTGGPHSFEASYDAGDGWGFQNRHRHPMNVTLASSDGKLTVTITPAAVPLPVDHNPAGETRNASTIPTPTSTGSDYLECLTCHVAHGTSVTMTGYANVADATNIEPNSGADGGVDPAGDSALLRLNNRGVCEVCHNK